MNQKLGSHINLISSCKAHHPLSSPLLWRTALRFGPFRFGSIHGGDRSMVGLDDLSLFQPQWFYELMIIPELHGFISLCLCIPAGGSSIQLYFFIKKKKKDINWFEMCSRSLSFSSFFLLSSLVSWFFQSCAELCISTIKAMWVILSSCLAFTWIKTMAMLSCLLCSRGASWSLCKPQYRQDFRPKLSYNSNKWEMGFPVWSALDRKILSSQQQQIQSCWSQFSLKSQPLSVIFLLLDFPASLLLLDSNKTKGQVWRHTTGKDLGA